MAMSQKPPAKIFIGGLSFSTTDATLRAFFAKYGEIIEAIVMKDSATKRSRGFGFIVFASSSSVDRVLAERDLRVDGRKVDAKRAVPRGDDDELDSPKPRPGLSSPSPRTPVGVSAPFHTPSGGRQGNTIHGTASSLSHRKIFAGGLHYGTDEDSLRRYFSVFGKISAAQVMYNRETCKSRGFGFVIFEDEASVDRAVATRMHVIDEKAVEVKRAVPKSEMPPVLDDSPPSAVVAPVVGAKPVAPPVPLPAAAPKPFVPAWGPNRGSILEKFRQPPQDTIPEDSPVLPEPAGVKPGPPRPLTLKPTEKVSAGMSSPAVLGGTPTGPWGNKTATPTPHTPTTGDTPAAAGVPPPSPHGSVAPPPSLSRSVIASESSLLSGMPPRRHSRSSSIVLSSCAASVGSAADGESFADTGMETDDFADNPFTVEDTDGGSRVDSRMGSALGSLDDDIVLDDRRSRSGSDALSTVSSVLASFRLGGSVDPALPTSAVKASSTRPPPSPIVRKLSTDMSVSSRHSFASSLGVAPSSPFTSSLSGLSLSDMLGVSEDAPIPLPRSTPSRHSADASSVSALPGTPNSFLFSGPGPVCGELEPSPLPSTNSLTQSLRDITSTELNAKWRMDSQHDSSGSVLFGTEPSFNVTQSDLEHFDIGRALAAGLIEEAADKEERQKSSFAYESGASAFSAGSVGSPNGSTSSGSSLRRHVTAPEFVSADGQDGEVDKTPVRRGLNPHAGAWHGGGGGYNPPLMTAVGSPMMGGGGGGSFMPMTGANGPPPMYFSPAGFMMPPPPAAMEQHFHMGPQYFHPMHYGEAMMGGGGYFDGGMYRPPSTLWIPREGPPILPPEDKSRHPPDHRLSRQ